MVGSAILRKLKDKGYNNFLFRSSGELDLRNQAMVNLFFEEEKPEFVFLSAAKVGEFWQTIHIRQILFTTIWLLS